MKKGFILFFIILIFTLNGAQIEFKASVDAEMIGMDDYLIYTVTFKGIQNPSQPNLANIGDFNIVQTSKSSEFKFVNGVTTSYVNFIYYLSPLKEGTLIIPSLKFTHENRIYKTKVFKIVAVKGSVKKVKKRSRSLFDFDDDFSPFGSRRSEPESIDVKIKAIVDKKSYYEGEQVLYKILLYSRNRIESVNLVSGQSFPGFWQEWYPVNKSIDGRSEIIGGKSYQVFQIRKAALFPTKSGKLIIPPVKFDLILSNDSFSFFSNPKKISRSTNKVIVDVVKVPGNIVGIPVGKFNFSINVNKDTIDIGNLASIKMVIRGFGNIKDVVIPQFSSDVTYKLFPPKISRKLNYRENGVYGTLIAEIPVSFSKTGDKSFESLKFRYFDPELSKEVVIKSSSFRIKVVGKKDGNPQISLDSGNGISRKGTDIDFIKKGDLKNQSDFIHRRPIYRITVFGLFFLSVLLIFYEFVVKKYILENTSIKKNIRIKKILKRFDGIKEFGDIFQIMEDYISEKANIGKSEISAAGIENLFYNAGITKSDVNEFLRIRSESELSRFSPSTIKTSSQVKDEIKILREIMKRIDSKLK